MNDPKPQEKGSRPRQLRLLEVGNPLTARFGSAFFQGLPRQPGVYFFYDATGRLLYIGQSNDLRARVGSYRHVAPERHPRRTLRLVHRIARIEFTTCTSHGEAQQLEAALLLERRPPFNRAGVWRSPPWWLALDLEEDLLHVRLVRTPVTAEACLGPLPSGFRYVHAALLRSLLRLLNPALGLGGFPVGWLDPAIPPVVRLRLHPDHRHIPGLIKGFTTGRCGRLLGEFQTALAAENFSAPAEQCFWLEQLETLGRFHARATLPALDTIELAAAPVAAEPILL